MSKGERASGTLSLAALFFVLTIMAILAACIGRVTGNPNVTTEVVTQVLIACCGAGAFLGFCVGFASRSGFRGVALGVAMGMMVGGIAAGLLLVDIENSTTLWAAGFGGGFVLVAMLMVTAHWQRST